MSSIEDIVDENLKLFVDSDLNRTPGKVEEEMADPLQDKNEEWRIWKAIPSKVTDSELDEFEKLIRYKLPNSYRRFLKYKHFHELYIGECSFCQHQVNTWRSSLNDMVFDGYPREYLLDKGLIPFANWSDWGHLCFDATSVQKNGEYTVVLWDHERWDEKELIASSFEELLNKLNSQ